MTWRLMVVCSQCGYVGASGHIDANSTPNLQVTEECPRCAKRRGALELRAPEPPSRFQQWRAIRRFRKQMDRLRLPPLSE